MCEVDATKLVAWPEKSTRRRGLFSVQDESLVRESPSDPVALVAGQF